MVSWTENRSQTGENRWNPWGVEVGVGPKQRGWRRNLDGKVEWSETRKGQ